jgi:Protein of unknown function (DUF1631)
MTTDAIHERTDRERLVVNVEGTRDIGPAEAEGLLRECLVLTHKRFDTASWRAIERLQALGPGNDDELGKSLATSELAYDLARAVTSKRSLVVPNFKARFDEAFQRRRDGKPSLRGQRKKKSFELAIVDHGDHSAKVALTGAVQTMREATLDEAFSLDFRVRMLLRETASGSAFDNPWSEDYICDAFGGTCRELWGQDDLWRPIMERLVRATTPQVVALHRELNLLLQDRDVLPTLRVRTRARRGGREPQELGGRALFDTLVQMMDGEAPALPSGAAAQAANYPWAAAEPTGVREAAGGAVAAGTPAASGSPPARRAESWAALVDEVARLQRTVPGVSEVTARGAKTMSESRRNELPALKAVAAKDGRMIDPATLDIVGGVLDYVFDDPYMPDEIKSVFGQMQIPMLKAALIDRSVLYDSQHPTRRFLDTLAAASVDLKPDDEHDRKLIALANDLATRIRDESVDDLGTFETAKRELDAFLDAERARSNHQLAKAVPLLIAQDEAAAARDEAVAAIEARLAGRTVTAEIRAFLDNDCVERLTAIDLDQGSESSAWERQLSLIDDLLASIGPKTTTTARKRLVETLPELLLRINRSWSVDDEVELRRQALLSCLLNLHIGSMKATTGARPGTGATASPGGAAAISGGTVAAQEPDDFDDRVQALVRGDWCAFKSDSAQTPVLARLAWRAPQRKRLLFSHRDGSTAFVHTPESLAEAFRTGRASLAIEAVPLFDRAMARLIDRRLPTSTPAAAVAA